MGLGTRHFYMLDGESLNALNKLIEYDGLLTDFRIGEHRRKAADILGQPNVVNNDEQIQLKLSLEFNTAQVRAYQESLGFVNPPVQVRAYGDGVLYRAYRAYPKMAMNPGTSAANFGFGDLFKKHKVAPEDRVAIYTSYEDYKGQHFAPPGAVKLTDGEYEAFDAIGESFEFYRTYDEGTALPADFDAEKHQTHQQMIHESFAINTFLLLDAARDKFAAYYKAIREWMMPDQDFRVKEMSPLLAQLTPEYYALCTSIKDPQEAGEPRVIEFHGMSARVWSHIQDDILQAFTLHKYSPGIMGSCDVELVPRLDTLIGQQVAAAMAKVPPYPAFPKDFGFENRPSLHNSAVFNQDISGFPYMKIEHFDNDQVKLLAFRLPPNVKTVDAPEDCTPLSPEDYVALGGSADDLPSHVFRIEGDAYQKLTEFDGKISAFYKNNATFKDHVLNIVEQSCTGIPIEQFELCSYQSQNRPRELSFTVPEALHLPIVNALSDHFTMAKPSCGYGVDGNWVSLTLTPQRDTENGRAMAALIDSIPYEPYWPKDLDEKFGFFSNKGYDHMNVEDMSKINQYAVVFKLPPYVRNIMPPEGTKALTVEEFLLLSAERWDVQAGSPLPPRPEHLQHLPVIEGASYTHLMNLKKSKDQRGLPISPRSDFNWFKLYK